MVNIENGILFLALHKLSLTHLLISSRFAQQISKALTLPCPSSDPVPASPPRPRRLEDSHSEILSPFPPFLLRTMSGGRQKGLMPVVPNRLFPGWQVGEESGNSSGFDGMEGGRGSAVIYFRNLSRFDKKRAMRKDGEAFSASFGCTDWEISFRRWADGKTSQLTTPISSRQHGHLLELQLSQPLTDWHKLRYKPKAQYLYAHKK